MECIQGVGMEKPFTAKLIQRLLFVALFIGTTPGIAVTPHHDIAKVIWSVKNVPVEGIDNLSFPIRIKAILKESGYFFATKIKMIGGNTDYVKIKPPYSATTLLFSFFGPGKYAIDTSGCKTGEEGGTGISCFVWLQHLIAGKSYFLNIDHDREDRFLWHRSLINVHDN